MKILVINAGSSSIKYKFFDIDKKLELSNWLIEEIWSKECTIKHITIHKNDKKNIYKAKIKINNHEEALNEILIKLSTWENSILKDLKEIDAIWHRVVHWGEEFSTPQLINTSVIKKIEKISPLAPLHNPINLEAIKICKKIMPKTKQVAIFDTSFYQDMTAENYLYPIPQKYYKKDKIRKYGFHWTSHDYVSHKACKFLKLNYNKQKIISCHIWNGASITAIKNWKAIDTSMWMTPLDGLMMWTRSWSIDPSIISVLYKNENKNLDDIDTILNKQSWLLWVSKKSNDMREVIAWIAQWDQNCKLAYDMFINRIIKYIWSYIALMWWVDTIVFTAWVLENKPSIRKEIINKLKFLWAEIDNNKNKKNWETIKISTDTSKVNIIIVPTDEEYMIAKHTHKIITSTK